ncbi:MAG TPA: HAD family hydrolase [Candidatus Acidoferrales bacterium]|nr:HAD family hydrolase [Candidatus Acidoferrales bacterium]
MAAIRLIAIDIDGTLLNSSFQVSEANRAMLACAHERGIEIALVTGRRHTFALPIAQSLGFAVTLISSNGAVTRSSTGELFHQDQLPQSVARRLVEYMTNWRDYLVFTFDRAGRGALVVEKVDELHRSIQRWMEKNAEYIEFVHPIENSLTADPIQAMFCSDIARMQEAEAHLRANTALLSSITLLKTQYEARDLCILDILNDGCSKGHALRRWVEHQGIQREEVMAIGDNYNDIEMLEFAGLPYLMGNACEALRHNGWPLTLCADENGVAHAIAQVLGGNQRR